VVALSTTGTKDSRSGSIHVDYRLANVGSTSVQDPPVWVEASLGRGAGVLDIMLVLIHNGTVDHDTVCGLLLECL
jgi:hypothetical protein